MKILIFYNTMAYVWHRRFFLRDLLARGDQVIAVAPFDGWEEKVESLGIKCVELPLSRRSGNPLGEIAALWFFYRIVRSEAPDAVILYTIKPIIYGSLGVRFIPGIRIFSVVTGLGYMFVEAGWLGRFRQLIARELYRVALTSNERVFFQNPDDMAVFMDKGVIELERAVLVPGSGVDTEFFEPADEPPEEGHFLLVSRMLWDKGIAQYVAAARRLKKKYPTATFTLLGPQDEIPNSIPADVLRGWDEEGCVCYLGPVDDIRPYLRRCSVYVLPSYYREGIPRTNLEALAMGKPIISTDMPGCRETVRDGVNGFLIPPRDEDALVRSMEKFLKDRKLAPRMGYPSRQLALDRFRLDIVNRAFIDALDGI